MRKSNQSPRRKQRGIKLETPRGAGYLTLAAVAKCLQAVTLLVARGNKAHGHNLMKTLAAFLAASLVLSLPLPVLADNGASGQGDLEPGNCVQDSSGQGVPGQDASNPDKFNQAVVVLSSAQDLLTLEKRCSLDTYSRGKTFLLENDVDLGDKAVTIPSFGGVFDGQGHTISGLVIADGVSDCGLFAYVQETGEIRHLNVEGMVVPAGTQARVGGIAGNNGGTILECSFSGMVHGTDYVGGIAGNNEAGGQLVNSTMSGAVIGTHFTGGITGQNEGVIFSCHNHAAVNTVLTETQNNLEGLGDMVYRLWKSYNSEEGVPSTTDTGGIAGYSTGIIRECENAGDVGYPHVGYNVGGIVGRQCGYMAACKNEGHVYGRKDVGGIAGQMVPNVSLAYENSPMAEIRGELDTLQTMLDQLMTDTGNAGDEIYARLKQISTYTDSARDSARWMGDYMVDYANDEIQKVNDASAVAASYQSRLQTIRGEFEDIQVRFGDCRQDLQNLREEVENSENFNHLGELADQLDAQLQDLWQGSEDGNFDINDDIDALRQRLQAVNDTLSAIRDEINNCFGDEEKDELKSIRDNFNAVCDDLDASSEHLHQCLSDMLNEEPVSIPAIDGEFSNQSQQLSSSLNAISGQLSLMNDEMRTSKDNILADMQNVNKQFMKIMNLFLDALDEVQDLSYEDVYEDVSDEDIANTTQGKVEGCTNLGVIEADVNVGGIAGAMAMEYDLDPEDDEKDAEHKSYRYTYQTRAILSGCVNYGEILAKKNCAGGVAGRMDLGIIIGGQSYGIISSSGGDYVGGICGYSLSTIRDSHAKCILGGGKYVGGIAGSGGTISRCRSMVSIVSANQFAGAIAGEVEGAANENYFVSEQLAGIDRTSYAGQAEGISYEQMLSLPEIPDAFRCLTVTFRTDDRLGETQQSEKDLKNYEHTVQKMLWLPYGSRVATTDYPQPEPPQGYYLVWDQPEIVTLTADMVVTGHYLQYATLLSADVLQEDGRPAVLVEGQFKQDDVVSAAQTGAASEERVNGHEVLEHWVVCWPDDGQESRNVRYHPNNGNMKKICIYVKGENGWEKADTTVSGGHVLIPATGGELEFAVVKTSLFAGM